MFIERDGLEIVPAPSGAAWLGHMPLLTELEKNVVDRSFYKHAAPNGVVRTWHNLRYPT